MVFPTSPSDDDIYNEYYYNSTRGAWKKAGELYHPVPI